MALQRAGTTIAPPEVHSKGRIRSPVYLSSWQVEDDNIIMTIRVGSFIRGGHYSGWTRLEWRTPVVILYAIISIMAIVLNETVHVHSLLRSLSPASLNL